MTGRLRTGDRATVVAELRGLAERLESNPDLPVPYSVDAYAHTVDMSDDDARVVIDGVAEILGVPARGGAHYTVETPGVVRYSVFHVPAAARARYDATMSYRDVVEPDEPTPAEPTAEERQARLDAALDRLAGHWQFGVKAARVALRMSGTSPAFVAAITESWVAAKLPGEFHADRDVLVAVLRGLDDTTPGRSA